MSSTAGPSLQLPSRAQIVAASAKVGHLLRNIKYAVIGGAACQILGSLRTTTDVDVVVAKGAVAATRKLLFAEKDEFTVDARTLHTHYKSTPSVQIEILSPPSMFREDFDESTPTMTVQVDGHAVSILHPVLILNAKCRSVLGRANEDKKTSDAFDIKFLLQYLAQVGAFPTSQQLPNASEAFIDWFVSIYGGEELWSNVQYDPNTGKSFLVTRKVI